jgi:hypothetical protein
MNSKRLAAIKENLGDCDLPPDSLDYLKHYTLDDLQGMIERNNELVRTQNNLKRAGVKSLHDLIAHKSSELMIVSGFGHTSLKYTRQWVAKRQGLFFEDDYNDGEPRAPHMMNMDAQQLQDHVQKGQEQVAHITPHAAIVPHVKEVRASKAERDFMREFLVRTIDERITDYKESYDMWINRDKADTSWVPDGSRPLTESEREAASARVRGMKFDPM